MTPQADKHEKQNRKGITTTKKLGRLFRKQHCVSFSDYRSEKRLAYGKDLLVQSEAAVLDIAARAGFRNITYFNRLFKRRYGTTPTEFRRKNVR